MAALEEFLLRDHPEVLAKAGDLGRHAEKAWIDLTVGSDSLTRIATTSEIERLKAEWAGPEPSPLEKLLVDHIAIAYLAQRQAEIAATQTKGTIAQAAFRLKKIESAQRRFLAAMKSLATLRALQPRLACPIRGPRLYDPEGRKVG
jgi:hypothetical protein